MKTPKGPKAKTPDISKLQGDINLFVDDEREPLPGWVWVKNYLDAIRVLENPNVRIVRMSLDHDLGLCPHCQALPIENCRHPQTGYDLTLWCAEHEKWSVEKPEVHSQNPVGRKSMLATIDRYWSPTL